MISKSRNLGKKTCYWPSKGCNNVPGGATMLQGVQQCYKGCYSVARGATVLQGAIILQRVQQFNVPWVH